MGKPLGIPYDYWHFLIPFIVLVISIPVVFSYFTLSFAFHILFEVVLILAMLQFYNEWRQAIDPYVSLKYGDLEGFQVNSKRDTKFFIEGLFGGLFVGFLVYALFL